MNKIDKSRKGMIFGCMTAEEQECLRAQKEIILCEQTTLWCKTNRPVWCPNLAYWSPAFDKLSGEGLVGKLCMLDDKHLCIVCGYVKTNGLYKTNGAYWHEARLATREEALSLIRIGGVK